MNAERLQQEQEKFIQIGIGNERYAIGIQEISEIIKMLDITEVPNSRSYIEGVINLRGKIVPVISLHKRFSLSQNPYTKATRIVVVNHREEFIGIVVDQVDQVIAFQDIQPPPERMEGIGVQFISGIGHNGEQLVSILKLAEIFRES